MIIEHVVGREVFTLARRTAERFADLVLGAQMEDQALALFEQNAAHRTDELKAEETRAALYI